MNEKLSQKLRALAAQDKTRAKSARLKEVYDDVMAAKIAGVSHKTIIQALADEGIEYNYETFTAALYRIKKNRNKAVKVKPDKPPLDEKPNVSMDAEDELSSASSSDPKELNKIFSTRPDLERYAKIAKDKQKMEKGK